MHQVMSQNTNLENRVDRGASNLNNITNNTDQNLQENFRNDTQTNSYYDQREPRGGHNGFARGIERDHQNYG